MSHPPPAAPRSILTLIGVMAVYAVVAAAILAPVARSPTLSTVGIPSIDSMDTAMLHALTTDAWQSLSAHSRAVYFPVGIDPFVLTPNLLDHLFAAPLTALLPWPLADNLWWWMVFLSNGLAAHWLGWRIGSGHRAGFLTGLAFITSEAVVREANLHHAPQTMLAWAPVLLTVLLLPRREHTHRTAALAAVSLALGALSYWYAGLFAVLACAPLLVIQRPRHMATGVAVVSLICAPFLLPQLLHWDTQPLTSGASLAPPRGVPDSFQALAESQQFIAWHGVDPLFWLRDTTMDTSNRVPLSLVVAAMLGSRAWRRRTRWALVWMVVLGGVMVLGPVLRWGEEVVLWGGAAVPLPFDAFRSLHPFFARLTWPERWGWLIPLGLIALASRAPRPALFAGLILLENFAVSANLPLQSDDLRHGTCWAEIPAGDRAVIELPLDRGLRSARAALHARMHGRPVVNPVLLPPGMRPPAEWDSWVQDSSMMQYLGRLERGRSPEDPGAAAVEALLETGIGAILVDTEPGHGLSEARQNRVRAVLGKHLGPPIDLGCAWVWWLDPDVPPPKAHADPVAWRKRAAAWKQNHPAPELPVLIQPMWDTLRQPDGRKR